MKSSWLRWPLVRQLRAIQFRRLRPFNGGAPRGTVVVRYYWADFLEKHRADIQGRGLEIGSADTLRQYGSEALRQAHAIDLAAHSPEVKLVADLSRGDHLPAEQYDCFVIQFTTAVIYDIDAFLYHAIRLLKPGGVLLINFWTMDFYFHNGLDMGTGAPIYMHRWFTPIQVHDLLRRQELSGEDYQVSVYGNLLTRMAFLMNLPAEELTGEELNHADPGQPLLICARIVKPVGWRAEKPPYRDAAWFPDAPPLQRGQETGQYGEHYK